MRLDNDTKVMILLNGMSKLFFPDTFIASCKSSFVKYPCMMLAILAKSVGKRRWVKIITVSIHRNPSLFFLMKKQIILLYLITINHCI